MTDGVPLEIERHAGAGHEVLVLRGELDLTNADELEGALSDGSDAAVILELSGLTFLDSAGIRTIDQAHRRLAGDGRSLLIVAPEGSRVAWTFRVAGFPDDLLLGTMDAALSRAAPTVA